jgi:AcrR family transcriptional regulator
MPKTTNQRGHIIETALELFATRGYASTPVSLIAKKAKVSQGLMYNFFKSKDELLRTMIEMGAKDIAQSMMAYHNIKDPKEAIRTHVLSTIEIIQHKQAFWKLLHAVRLQGLVLKMVEHQFHKIMSDVTGIFERVFRQLNIRNPKLEAILFLTQIDGLVILYLQNENIPLKKLADQLIKRYV